MLLCEVINYVNLFESLSNERLQEKFISELRNTSSGDRNPRLNALTTAMINRFPEYKYEGVMYRAINMRPDNICKFDNVADLLKYIDDTNFRNKQQFQSWASDMRGAIRYLNLALSARTSDKITWQKPSVVMTRNGAFVILEQKNIGFDCRKFVMGNDIRTLHPMIQVFEVLSLPSSTMRIGVLALDSIEKEQPIIRPKKAKTGEHYVGRRIFKPSDFDKMKQIIKAHQENDIESITTIQHNQPDERSKYNSKALKPMNPTTTMVGRDYYDKI